MRGNQPPGTVFAGLVGGLHSFAFTLVEVVMAMGIVSCSLLVIVGLLPVGLRTLNDSAVQYGITTIAQKISSELQEMPFLPSVSNPNYAITQLNNRTDSYTREGAFLSNTNDPTRYFAVSFSTGNSTIPGATNSTYANNIQTVRATITYPALAPAASQQTNVLSFLAAKQNNL